MTRALVLGSVMLAACGSGDGKPASRALEAVSIIAPAGAPGDVVVATVDGRPVWGSCVTAQAAHGKLPRERALAECIDFELLAGAANARALGSDPAVAEALQAAMVNRLVAREVEARLDAPDTVQPLLERQLDRFASNMEQPELRDSAFIRVEVPKDAPPTAWDEAKRLADKMYAELEGETGLHITHLEAVAREVRPSTTQTINVTPFRLETLRGVVPDFGRPLFAIPEVGRVAPPARTSWGWDIILLTDLKPAKRYTREEVAFELLPETQRTYFRRWVDQIVAQYGAITYDQEQLSALEAL